MAENWIEPIGKFENVVREFMATPEGVRMAQEVRIALQMEYDLPFMLRTGEGAIAPLYIAVSREALKSSSSNLNNMKGFANGYAKHIEVARRALRALIGE